MTKVNPKDLRRAEDKISALEKERDLLRTSLENEKNAAKKEIQKIRDEVANSPKVDIKKYKTLELERDGLVKQLDDSGKMLARRHDESSGIVSPSASTSKQRFA